MSLGNLISRRSTNWAATGYLGYTSHSTIMEETLSILNFQPGSDTLVTPAEGGQVTISRHLLQLGVAVLSHIPDAEVGHSLLREPKAMDSWIHIIARRFLDSLYQEYGTTLGKTRDPAKLEIMAHRISVNTAKAPGHGATDPDEWLAHFQGPNLRWESLGNPSNHQSNPCGCVHANLDYSRAFVQLLEVAGRSSLSRARLAAGAATC
jgi:hypothetical protein